MTEPTRTPEAFKGWKVNQPERTYDDLDGVDDDELAKLFDPIISFAKGLHPARRKAYVFMLKYVGAYDAEYLCDWLPGALSDPTRVLSENGGLDFTDPFIEQQYNSDLLAKWSLHDTATRLRWMENKHRSDSNNPPPWKEPCFCLKHGVNHQSDAE